MNCVSTIEAIVAALQILEPNLIDQLHGLVGVFGSMVEDQRISMETKRPPQQ